MLVPGYLLGRDRAGIAKRATELADWVGISHVIKKLPSQVSGGELQRAAVARSLVNAPAILLADEPTGSLDAESGEQVMKLFSKAQKEYGTTVILVTHDRQIAGQADRVWAIDGVSA
jgi:ABC-type lipoprotein export system ATPase subunit